MRWVGEIIKDDQIVSDPAVKWANQYVDKKRFDLYDGDPLLISQWKNEVRYFQNRQKPGKRERESSPKHSSPQLPRIFVSDKPVQGQEQDQKIFISQKLLQNPIRLERTAKSQAGPRRPRELGQRSANVPVRETMPSPPRQVADLKRVSLQQNPTIEDKKLFLATRKAEYLANPTLGKFHQKPTLEQIMHGRAQELEEVEVLAELHKELRRLEAKNKKPRIIQV